MAVFAIWNLDLLGRNLLGLYLLFGILTCWAVTCYGSIRLYSSTVKVKVSEVDELLRWSLVTTFQ